tara:strand:- start:801 stop:1625 length:825 start_codon:yes stop_codon:yes gene_type:complete
VPVPIPKKISQILPTFQNVAQTSHYLVNFGLPSKGLKSHLQARGVDHRFHMSEIGLLCSAAVLPGSAFATELVRGNYQGVMETMPHTRNFTEIQLEFYVDNEYKSLKFLEHWMEYITGGSGADPSGDAYNFQLNYPELYKSDTTTITKFERNYRQRLEYTFRGLFPKSLSMARVSYQSSNVLRTTATFAFDRYICGSDRSSDRRRGTDNNKVSSNSAANRLYNKETASPTPGNIELLNSSQGELESLKNYASKLGDKLYGTPSGGSVISEGRVL